MVERQFSVTAESRRLPWGQAMLLASALLCVIAIAVIDLSRVSPVFLGGVGAIVVLSVVTVVAGRLSHPAPGEPPSTWFALIPIADIVACAFVRADVIDTLPAVGMLVVFPVAWLAFAFPVPHLAVGIATTCFVTAYPLLRTGFDLSSAADWTRVLTLPVIVTLFAIATASIGHDLDRQQLVAEREAARAREAQRTSTEATLTIRALADTTPDALAVFDPDGVAVIANEAARAIGVRAGRSEMRLDGEEAEVWNEAGTERIAIGTDILDQVVDGRISGANRVVVGPPGDRVTLSVTAGPVLDDAGQVRALILIGHDVTELVGAIEVRDTFLDTVGHELKTPLTAILGHADLLAMSPDAAVAEQGGTIRRAAERQLAIVNQLIAEGRDAAQRDSAGATASPARTEVTRAGDAVQAGARRARAAAEEKGVEFAVVDDTVPGEPVLFSAADLEAVTDALAGNAVLFTETGGTVVIGLRRSGASMILEVTDTGIGMSESDRRLAFERFHRAASSRRDAVPGLGLGLSIARRLAEAHGAELTLDSTPGHGTVATLTMRLPPT